MYVLFASLLKFFNLAFIEIIWLFFCLFHIFRLFGYFFGFFYFLYVLFGFSLKFSNLASIEIIWQFFDLFVLCFCITWIILLVHLIWIQRPKRITRFYLFFPIECQVGFCHSSVTCPRNTWQPVLSETVNMSSVYLFAECN